MIYEDLFDYGLFITTKELLVFIQAVLKPFRFHLSLKLTIIHFTPIVIIFCIVEHELHT